MQNEIAELAKLMDGYNSDDELQQEPEGLLRNIQSTQTKASKIQNSSLKSQLKSMVSASKDVLNKVKIRYYDLCEDPEQTCDFTSKTLSLKEVTFYKQNSSVAKILRNLKSKIDSVTSYELFMEELLSEQQKEGIKITVGISNYPFVIFAI